MSSVTKIKLPDGSQHEIGVKSQNISGVVPLEKGGTNASSLREARQILGIEDVQEISNSEIEALMSR